MAKERISISKLVNNDIFEWTRYIYACSPQNLFIRLAEIGIIVDEFKDLETLANLAKVGGDVNGILETNGMSIKFDFLDILKNKVQINNPIFFVDFIQ